MPPKDGDLASHSLIHSHIHVPEQLLSVSVHNLMLQLGAIAEDTSPEWYDVRLKPKRGVWETKFLPTTQIHQAKVI